jgi:hypothetical protein
MGSPLLPLLAALSTFPGALDGGLGGCGPTNISRRSHVAQDEGGPNHLLTSGVSSCDVEQLLGGFWLFVAELVNQGASHHAAPEHRDDVGVGHTRKLMVLL